MWMYGRGVDRRESAMDRRYMVRLICRLDGRDVDCRESAADRPSGTRLPWQVEARQLSLWCYWGTLLCLVPNWWYCSW